MLRSLLRPALAAMLLLVTISPAQARSTGTYTGSWAGKTSQSKTVKFHVNGDNKIDSVKISIYIPFKNCSGGVTLSAKRKFSPPIAIGSDGAFKTDWGFETATASEWKGSFTSSEKAKGKFWSGHYDNSSGCNGQKSVKWNAGE